MELHRVVEWLDRCVFDATNTCTRCGTHMDEPLDPGQFMMCEKGRKHQIGWSFFCPGCGFYHQYATEQSQLEGARPGPIWSFDGNLAMPTFSPSLLVRGGPQHHTCHLFLRAGVIEYLGDCSHPFKGRKINLADVVPEY